MKIGLNISKYIDDPNKNDLDGKQIAHAQISQISGFADTNNYNNNYNNNSFIDNSPLIMNDNNVMSRRDIGSQQNNYYNQQQNYFGYAPLQKGFNQPQPQQIQAPVYEPNYPGIADPNYGIGNGNNNGGFFI